MSVDPKMARDAEIADYIDAYAARVLAGPPARVEGGFPINRHLFPPDQAREYATLLRGLASSVRAGLTDDPRPATRALTFGPVVQAIVAERIAQIARHGHDAAHDRSGSAERLPRVAKDYLQGAIDQIACAAETRNLVAARRNVVRACAVGLAAIDRIDAEIADSIGEPGA